MPDKSSINHVSDTALWVAYYRAEESKRPSPLFKDPYAEILVGDRGQQIAKSMKATSMYTRWSVVIRTRIIDDFLKKYTADGVDTILNLGAGQDTRPYRLDLPASTKWIEVDYPHVIEYKENLLKDKIPKFNLERVSLDLADRHKRQELFQRIGSEARKVMVITEGVLPYLSEDEVKTLAEDLLKQKNFKFWVAEYFHSMVYKYLRDEKRLKRMKNAPFKFFPNNWLDFFKNAGWKLHEIKYLPQESHRLGRPMPMPWWAHFILPLIPKVKKRELSEQSGYVIFTQA